jgi:hypothetical protein
MQVAAFPKFQDRDNKKEQQADCYGKCQRFGDAGN